jgi:hypothetical protein
LNELFTVQFVLPSTATAGLSVIKITANANTLLKAQAQASTSPSAPAGAAATVAFDAYYQDEHVIAEQGAVEITYPPNLAVAGQPAHVSLVETGPDGQPRGGAVVAVWISFEAADSDGHWPPVNPCGDANTAAPGSSHCCRIVHDLPINDTANGCTIGVSSWDCSSDSVSFDSSKNTRVWEQGQPVTAINYRAPLAATVATAAMADGKPLFLHLDDTADLGEVISNSYARHPVVDSPACQRLCSSLKQNPKLDLFGNANAAECKLSGLPTFWAADGYGPITVRGYGRVNGQMMMRNMMFKGKPVWEDPGNGILNGYGAVVDGFATVADAEPHTRWRIQSGLVELSTAATSSRFAVDVSGISVAWGPKRGDGAVRLQFPRVPLDGGKSVATSNVAAKLYDVKTPGTWVGASDGPRVTADTSWVGFCYLHHADDNLKIDSSLAVYKSITLIQGNIGSAIELGTYGIGLRDNAVHHTTVTGIYVHRIAQTDGQDDSIGSLLGSRTCPWGISLRNISVVDVYVPSVGGHNKVNALINLGALGPPTQKFVKYSNLDRWFFCSNPWWLDKETIISSGEAVSMEGITLTGWKVELVPAAKSLLYNFNVNATTTFSGFAFEDEQGRHSVPFLSNLSGVYPLFYR